MNNICFVFIGLLFYSFSTELKGQLVDSSQVLAYYEKGKTFFPAAPDSTEYYYQKGIDLAKEIGYIKGQVTILRSRGALRGFTGRNEEGYADLFLAMDLIEEYNLPVIEKINCLINLGLGYLRAGDEGPALAAYIEGEELSREHNYPEKRSSLLNNIAIIYKRGERYDEAIKIYQQSEELRIEQKDSAGLANVYFNMAGCYAEMNEPAFQLEYVLRARSLYESLGQQNDVLLTDAVYGEALIKMSRAKEGVAILDNLDLSSLQLHDASIILQYAQGLHDLGRIKDSQVQLALIEDDLLSSDFDGYKAFWYQLTAENESKLQNYGTAYVALDSFVSIQERLTTSESVTLKREMEEKYLSKQKDLELEVQEGQLQVARRNRLFLIAGLFVLGFIAVQQYRTSRFRKKVNKELNSKNEIISKGLEEKEILLKEIHHRVKNNLQFISALLGLQTDHVSDKVALGALQEGQDRVQSMALIHQDLYQRDDLTSVNMKEYFEKLINGLFDSYNIRTNDIILDMNIEELNLDVDTVVPIGLIVNELVSNSLKYAFAGRDGGHISVGLQEVNDKLELVVADDGIGITPERKGTLGESLGYKLIKALTGQLKGTWEIKNGEGTIVTVLITKYEKSRL